MRNTLRLCALGATATLALVFSGCNGSSDSGGSSGSTDQSATGLWSGTDSVTGLAITAFVNSTGESVFIRSDGALFIGALQISTSTLAATVDGYAAYPANFPDGSNYGIGTLSGTVTTASALTATLAFTTNGGTSVTGTWPLGYLSISTNSSSTAIVAGNYTDTVTGQVLSINSNGVMTEQNASGTTFGGCVLNGTISTADSTHNVYEVSYTLASCAGNAAVLNGAQFTGLASLNTSASPAQLTIAVSGTNSSGAQYGIVSTLTSS
jgi:hypothetical protein